MSTRFTQRGIPMAESQSLRLILASTALRDRAAESVGKYLQLQGFESISPSLLHFLSALDCGANYSAEIARRLQVSRQMVTKTVKELCRSGYLEQKSGTGKQKQIVFTDRGERLMSAVRAILADLDFVLNERWGEGAVDEMAVQLEAFATELTKLLNRFPSD